MSNAKETNGSTANAEKDRFGIQFWNSQRASLFVNLRFAERDGNTDTALT